MGLLEALGLRRKAQGITIRCAMCKVHTTYPEAQRNSFVFHTCDADLLVRERDAASEGEALDLLVAAVAEGPRGETERIAARDRLLYELGEGPIPGLEDLLYRIKYEPGEPFPFAEIAQRAGAQAKPQRIDWGNELEMFLHRMKKFAITKRQLDSVAESARPILRDKLERLKKDPLVPLEED